MLVEKQKNRAGSAAAASVRGEESVEFDGVEQEGPESSPAPAIREQQSRPEPEIDDDGFITVGSGGKHRGA